MKRKRESGESRRRRWNRPGSGASTSPLFRFNPTTRTRRRIIPDVYLQRVHGPRPGHVRDQSSSRVCVRYTREPDITRCGTSSILVRRLCTAISIFRRRAESYSRAIFRILLHETPYTRPMPIVRFYTNVRKFASHNLHPGNCNPRY